MNVTEYQIVLFFLIMVRFTSMFLSAPVFSIRGIPMITKLGLAMVLGLLVFPLVSGVTPVIELNLLNVTVLMFGEILTGITIGIIINFLFSGVELAGEYIGVDIGLSMAQEIDPMFNQPISVIARLKNIVAMLIFVIIDGHHFLIEAVVHSFRLLPIGTWNINQLALHRILQISASVFTIGIKIAAPAIVTLFLTSVAMAITARAVPQMNIFFVGIPLRIGAGFFAIIVGLPLFLMLFKQLLQTFETDILYLIQVM